MTEAEKDAERLWNEWYAHGTPIRERFIRIVAAELDKRDEEIERLNAEMGYHEAKDVIAQLEAQLAEARAELAEANSALAKAKRDVAGCSARMLELDMELAAQAKEVERLKAEVEPASDHLNGLCDAKYCGALDELEKERLVRKGVERELSDLRAFQHCEIDEAKRERDEARAENERLKDAISDTLETAGILNDAAANGAGFIEHWGERVTQTVEKLRDVDSHASETLRHNRILLEHNGKMVDENNRLRAALDGAEQRQREFVEAWSLAINPSYLQKRMACISHAGWEALKILAAKPAGGDDGQ